jgi:hypothetical protein
MLIWVIRKLSGPYISTFDVKHFTAIQLHARAFNATYNIHVHV